MKKKSFSINWAVVVALILVLILLMVALMQRGIIPAIPYLIKAAPLMHGEMDIVCYNYKLGKEIGYDNARVLAMDTDGDVRPDTFMVDATLDGNINGKGDFPIYVGNFDPNSIKFGTVFIPLSGAIDSRSASMVTIIVEVTLHQLNYYKQAINNKLNELLNVPRKDSVAATNLEMEMNRLISEEKRITTAFRQLPYILGLKEPAIDCYMLNLRELDCDYNGVCDTGEDSTCDDCKY